MNCDKLRHRLPNPLTPPSANGTQEPPIPMTLVCVLSARPRALLVCAVVCGCGASSRPRPQQPVTIRLSTGFPTGNFRPFSEALVKGYAQLMPDVRVEAVDTRGSLRNIEALQDGTVDIGLAQAGIAYMAYNGRLREVGRRAARHSRHRHTELLSGASARRSRLANSLDGRTAGPPRGHRP